MDINMVADYPGALDMIFHDPSYVFVDALKNVQNQDISIVLHKTASGGQVSAQDIANYFHNNTSHVSTHFVIGKDGTVVQVVSLSDGAGGNCCATNGYDTYWKPFIQGYKNLNLCTISIEHVDWTHDNSDPMPDAQIMASYDLVGWLVDRYNLPLSHIKTHASIDPVNRARCPGSTYDVLALLSYLSGKNMGQIPQGWSDDGTVLKAPNGFQVVLGFRGWILDHDWNHDNVPQENEHGANPCMLHRKDLGSGTRQCFRDSVLYWFPDSNQVVYEQYPGLEIFECYNELEATSASEAEKQIQALQEKLSQIEQIVKM